jgi:hypothetical protein
MVGPVFHCHARWGKGRGEGEQEASKTGVHVNKFDPTLRHILQDASFTHGTVQSSVTVGCPSQPTL